MVAGSREGSAWGNRAAAILPPSMARLRQVRRVLLVGWGFLGAAVGRRLALDGQSLVGLTRSDSVEARRARALGIQMVIGDAANSAVLEEALNGVDYVICAAGGL